MLDSERDALIMQMGLTVLTIGIRFAKVLLDHPELLEQYQANGNELSSKNSMES